MVSTELAIALARDGDDSGDRFRLAALAIMHEASDRRGFDFLTLDDETRDEILASWRSILVEVLGSDNDD